jgi:hypothetical protein
MPTDKLKWQPTDEIMAGECEKLFQAGGPRVYTLWRHGSRELTPCSMSATRAARTIGPGEAVYARRKAGARYAWMCIVRRAALAQQGKQNG